MEKIPTDIDWAQLASFIDGEGSIRINEVPYDRARKIYYNCNLHVFISNTDIRLMNHFKSLFGGSIHVGNHKTNNHRTCYKWCVAAKKAEAILKGCLPYFIIKREQAEVALAFRATIITNNSNPISDSVKEQRHEFARELSALKFKDWNDDSTTDIESLTVN